MAPWVRTACEPLTDTNTWVRVAASQSANVGLIPSPTHTNDFRKNIRDSPAWHWQ